MQTQTIWGIAADDSTRRVTLLGLLSLFGHVLFLSPLGALLGLLTFREPEVEAPPLDPITEIPVSLFDDPGGELAAPKAPEAPVEAPKAPASPAVLPAEPTVAPAPKPSAAPKKPEPVVKDAGAPKPKPPKPVKPKAKADAGAKATGEGDPKKPPRIADPSSLVGSAADLADKKANVRLFIYTERIRGHLLGERIGALFSALPQWQSFLGGTRLDMVRDVDAMLITGPQFRRSDEVMAVLDYNVPQAQMRGTINELVKRDAAGKWLDTKFPAAIATADRAQRLFALPKARLAIVSPLSAQQSVLKQGPTLDFKKPPGNEAVVAHIQTPWRVFLGTQFSLPKSIKWMSVRATPVGQGDVTVQVLAEDVSEEAAKDNARSVTRSINEAAQLGGLGSILAGFGFTPLIDRVELQAEGTKIHGTLHVTAAQLRRLLGYVEAWAEAASGRREAPKEKPAKRKPATPAASAAPAASSSAPPSVAPKPSTEAAPSPAPSATP